MNKIPYTVRKAIDVISGYCGKHFSCEKCPLEDFCKPEFTNPPVDWGKREKQEPDP